MRVGDQDERLRQLGGEVLQAVDGGVRAAIEQRLFELLHEDGLAADLGEWSLGGAVALGGHRHDLGLNAEREVAQASGDPVRLGEGERAAAAGDSKGHFGK
jgi:hypothetical protein